MDNLLEQKTQLAKSGCVESQIYVGTVMCLDVNNKKDLKLGINWLEIASKTNSEAQYILGKIYGVKLKESKTAFKWLERSAENGHIPAMLDAGAYLQLGLGVKKDVKSAIFWYEKAAGHNHAVAQHSIGYIYYTGLDYKQDFDKAYKWLKLAADNGYADACGTIGLMYYNGQGFAQNVNEAIEWFEKAAYFGKAEVCRLLGNLYHEHNTDKPNNEKALNWFQRGTELGDDICAYLAGTMCYDGLGCDMDYREAFQYYLLAANKGMADACVEVANMLINGEGVQKDTKMAEKWLHRAKYYGNEHAPRLLEIAQKINGTKVVKSATRTGISSLSVGSSLGGTTYTGLSDYEVKIESEQAQKKEKRQGVMRAAGARTSGHSYGDDTFGYVFSKDGDVAQYVDFDTGIIFDSKGKVAYYDEKTKMTYDTKDSSLSYYDETFDLTYNLKTGERSYHMGEITHKW